MSSYFLKNDIYRITGFFCLVVLLQFPHLKSVMAITNNLCTERMRTPTESKTMRWRNTKLLQKQQACGLRLFLFNIPSLNNRMYGYILSKFKKTEVIHREQSLGKSCHNVYIVLL